jgi:hypothetical protein
MVSFKPWPFNFGENICSKPAYKSVHTTFSASFLFRETTWKFWLQLLILRRQFLHLKNMYICIDMWDCIQSDPWIYALIYGSYSWYQFEWKISYRIVSCSRQFRSYLCSKCNLIWRGYLSKNFLCMRSLRKLNNKELIVNNNTFCFATIDKVFY